MLVCSLDLELFLWSSPNQASLAGKSMAEAGILTVDSNTEPASATTGGNGDAHSGLPASSKPTDSGLKREEANPSNNHDSNVTKRSLGLLN